MIITLSEWQRRWPHLVFHLNAYVHNRANERARRKLQCFEGKNENFDKKLLFLRSLSPVATYPLGLRFLRCVAFWKVLHWFPYLDIDELMYVLPKRNAMQNSKKWLCKCVYNYLHFYTI